MLWHVGSPYTNTQSNTPPPLPTRHDDYVLFVPFDNFEGGPSTSNAGPSGSGGSSWTMPPPPPPPKPPADLKCEVERTLLLAEVARNNALAKNPSFGFTAAGQYPVIGLCRKLPFVRASDIDDIRTRKFDPRNLIRLRAWTGVLPEVSSKEYSMLVWLECWSVFRRIWDTFFLDRFPDGSGHRCGLFHLLFMPQGTDVQARGLYQLGVLAPYLVFGQHSSGRGSLVRLGPG